MRIVAHRGASSEAPENTQAAIDAALAYPIWGIEFDVQLSKDGIPVLYHDRTLYKVIKRKKRLSDYSLLELEKMSWGSWFSDAYKAESILLFDDVLKRYHHQTRLLIEIKSRKIDRAIGRSQVLTTKVIEKIQKVVPKPFQDQIFIISFDPTIITHALELEPQWNYILNLPDSPLDDWDKSFLLESLTGVGVPVNRLSTTLSKYYHDHSKLVMTYTCNITRQLGKALQCNADIILTDNPRWLIEQTSNRRFSQNSFSLSAQLC